jgi:hypothetical protein
MAAEEGVVESVGLTVVDPKLNGDAGAGALDPREKSDDPPEGLGEEAAATVAEPNAKGEALLVVLAGVVVVEGEATGVNEKGVAAAGLGAPGTGIELKGFESFANGFEGGGASVKGVSFFSVEAGGGAAGLLEADPKLNPADAIPPKGFFGGAPKPAAGEPKAEMEGGGVCNVCQEGNQSVVTRRKEFGERQLTDVAELGDASAGFAVFLAGKPRILRVEKRRVWSVLEGQFESPARGSETHTLRSGGGAFASFNKQGRKSTVVSNRPSSIKRVASDPTDYLLDLFFV